MKEDLKRSAVRHSERLLSDLSEIMDIPNIAADRIRREIEYATMDGHRITMKSVKEGSENDSANDSKFNR